MIEIKSQNKLLLNSINNYFISKGFVLSSISKNLFTIDIDNNEKNLTIKFNEIKKTFMLPVEINLVASYILENIKNISVPIKSFNYFPYKRSISSHKKKSNLTDIQNTIFYNLFFSQNGIDKDFLYEIIWTKDKNISINKLDTHLTNLKNQLIRDLGLKINFHSNKKNLQLSID